MPIAVPLVAAAVEYGATTTIGLAAIGGAEAAAGLGSAAYGSFAAADALAETGAVSSLSGLQLAGLAASTVGGVGQALQGSAAAQSAEYNAKIAANNAIIAKQNAASTIEEGQINSANSSEAARAKIGGILANQGASGVDVNSGSSVDVRSSAAQNGELNAINIRASAARQAYGYQSEAVNASAQEKMDKSESSMDELTGGINAGSTLLSGATNPNNPFGSYLASQSMSGGL